MNEYNYYLDFVLYSNIKAEVILLVTIKEGTKILKGLKYTFKDNKCNILFDKNRNEFLKMRIILFNFKLLLDELIIKISKKWCIDVATNHHKKIFENRVTKVLELLENPDIKIEEIDKTETCSKLKKELEPIENAYVGDKFNLIFLEKYYFYTPLVNIRNLYYNFDKYFI